MRIALGVLLFLLGVVSMAPILGFSVNHSASAFVMSVGLAERDGLAVMIGALAGVASLALAAMSIIPGKRIWITARNWLAGCFRRLHLHAAAWILDQVDKGLGALLRLRWSTLLYVFAADVAGVLDPSVFTKRSLRLRIERIRNAERQRANNYRRTRDGA